MSYLIARNLLAATYHRGDMGTTTRTELSQALAEQFGCTKAFARRLVDGLFGALRDALLGGHRIEIRGFGVFEVALMKPRQARNPKTGEQVQVAARRKVRFRPGKQVREALARPLRKARVLVIDDEASVRNVVCTMLRLAGYSVVVAAIDGADGLAKHRKQPADVAIVDIFMPEKSGLEVMQELRRDSPNVKIIAITGVRLQDGLDMAPLALRYGAHRVMEKPFTKEELVGAVEEAIAQQ